MELRLLCVIVRVDRMVLGERNWVVVIGEQDFAIKRLSLELWIVCICVGKRLLQYDNLRVVIEG